jgi:hypothetical protein
MKREVTTLSELRRNCVAALCMMVAVTVGIVLVMALSGTWL